MSQFNGNLWEKLYIKRPKSLILDGHWAKLNFAAKQIYLPICKHVNEKGKCKPGQQTIGKVAGVTEKTVREGMESLKGFPGFEAQKYITRRGRWSYKYYIEPAPDKNSDCFSINHAFFNGENYSQLNPSAKAILPVLCCFAWWDYYIYSGCTGEGLEGIADEDEVGEKAKQYYIKREYDFLSAESRAVAKLAGTQVRSISNAYKSLKEAGFIENYDTVSDFEEEENIKWIFYTRPAHTYEPE